MRHCLLQATALFVGRICGEAEGGRLVEGDLLLEGSLATSSAARVLLDLSRVASFRVFPGQVRVLVEQNVLPMCGLQA